MFTPIFEPIFKPLFRSMYSGGVVPLDYARWEFGGYPNGYRMRGKATPLSFSRASSATQVNSAGLIESVGNDILRSDHDPLTGEGLGGLFEGQKVNLCPHSENIAAWVLIGGATVTPNVEAAPDGNQTADRVNTVAGSDSSYFRYNYSGLAEAATYTKSVFIKCTDFDFFVIRAATGGLHYEVVYQISTDSFSVLSSSPGYTADVGRELMDDGWIRLYIHHTLPAGASSASYLLRPRSNSGGVGPSDAVASWCFAWGGQLETGGLSSYVPTSGSQLTRQADTCTIPDLAAAGFDPAGGMILAKVRSYPGSVGANSRRLFFTHGSNGIEMRFTRGPHPNNYPIMIVDGVSTQGQLGPDFVSETEWEYLAFCWSATNGCYGARKTGSGAVTVSSNIGNYTPSIVPTVASLGVNLNGHIRTFELHGSMPDPADIPDILNAFALS